MSETAIAKKQAPIVQLIESRREDFNKLITDAIGLERFMRVAMTTIGRSPKLQACSQASLLAGIMDAAQLGLEIGGPLQEGWLIPYKGEAQFQPGYRGLISLVIGTGLVKKVESHVVYGRDLFEVDFGDAPKITHRPYLGDDDNQKMVAVYATAWLANGEKQSDVLLPADVERARSSSRTASDSDSPWRKHTGEMWRKSACKRLIKYLRLKGVGADKVERALELDERDYEATAVIADVPGADQPGRRLSLKREQPKDADLVVEPAADVKHSSDCPANIGEGCECGAA
jgi:recombination protein RecT